MLFSKHVTIQTGSGGDNYVQRLETSYDALGNAALFTSWSLPAGGVIRSQVKRDFNNFGQLTAEWQAHTGAVDGSTPKVRYVYSTPSATANNSRLTQLVYPAATKKVDYSYTVGDSAHVSSGQQSYR